MDLCRALHDGPISMMATDLPRYPALALENDARFVAHLLDQRIGGISHVHFTLPNAGFLNVFLWTLLEAFIRVRHGHAREVWMHIDNAPPFRLGSMDGIPNVRLVRFRHMKLKSPSQVLGHLEHLPANTIYFEQCGVTLKEFTKFSQSTPLKCTRSNYNEAGRLCGEDEALFWWGVCR
jgi:hypothetical protein